MPLDLISQLKKNPFILAPMAGITDSPFRSFMKEMGAGIVITELVSATGLLFNSDKTLKLMSFEEIQRPIGVQIFGYELDHFTFAAKEAENRGADFIDLNFGCPVPKVVKRGAGAATLKDLVQLRNILRAIRKSVELPITIKVRTGWDQDHRNSVEVAQIAYDEGITWMAIHGRTRKQGYSGQADWEYIKYVAENSPLPILGNGDITTAPIAQMRMKESGCQGVMIGRGCLKNPWIFKTSQGYKPERNFPKLFKKLRNYFESSYPERICTLQLKKMSSWYSSGYPGSTQLRKSIFQCKGLNEVYDTTLAFFEPLSCKEPENTSTEGFLMGGHG